MGDGIVPHNIFGPRHLLHIAARGGIGGLIAGSRAGASGKHEDKYYRVKTFHPTAPLDHVRRGIGEVYRAVASGDTGSLR